VPKLINAPPPSHRQLSSAAKRVCQQRLAASMQGRGIVHYKNGSAH
jgi:hypothetical protein